MCVCTIKEYIQPKRCFRCMGFSHNARECKGVDRSKTSRNCGTEGHFAKGCTNDPKCMLCIDEQGKPSHHSPSHSTHLNMKVIQINLNHCKAAHDLLVQTVLEKGIDVAIISDPYIILKNSSWVGDRKSTTP